jgi:ubiquinone/menaquinone biosynthesis C-methylase UbiE
MKRVPQFELLDHDQGTPEEIAASLQDLRTINRNFGGIATTRRLLQHAMQSASLKRASLLEVAAGDGYAIEQAVRRLPSPIAVDVTLLDRRGSHGSNGNRATITGDALHLPFSDGSFDFISCGLFVHHLAPHDVVRFVSEALRVARHALLINDLVRSRIHLAMVYFGFPLFRSRITYHDAPASVRQAYTVSELRDLLRQASPARIEISRVFLYRMAAIAWK